MDTTKLEERVLEKRVNIANKKLYKIAQLLNLFDKLEGKVLEQEKTIGTLTSQLVSVLDNVDNVLVLDDAVQRVESIIENYKEKKVSSSLPPNKNYKENVIMDSPRPIADASPRLDDDDEDKEQHG